uniref:Type III secretion protein n=1 Tax=Ascaris lumbricoides TaxID=6252 RepID=A0A0M3IT37_ASCLU
MLSKLKLLRKKEAYLDCREAQLQQMHLKEAIRKQKRALRKVSSEIDQVQTTLKSKRRAQERYRRENDSLREQSQLICDEFRMSTQFDQLVKRIAEARIRYGEVVMNLYSWEAEVEKAETLVKEHEAKLADETKDSSLEEGKRTLKLEYNKLLQKEDELDQQTAKINNEFSQLKHEKDGIFFKW